MNFDFDTPVDRRPTDSMKWAKSRTRDAIPMWLADMDFASPPPVMDALVRRARHGLFGYTAPQPSLVRAVVDFYRDSFGWTIDPEWIQWLPDLGVGLSLVCQAFAEPGDDILLSTPIYHPFLTAVDTADCRRVTPPLDLSGGRWMLNPEAIARAVTPRSRLYLLCNPHNPVGRLYTPEEVRRVAELCVERNLVLCSDEVHCQLILDRGRRHTPTAMLSPEIAERTVTLMAPSKTYNVPGLRCAFMVVPSPELRERLTRARRGLVSGGNIFGYVAAETAFREGGPWLEALLDYLRGNRDLLEQFVAETPGLAMAHVEATYLAWIDARGLGLEKPADVFDRAGVTLADGRGFGLDGYVRLTFATPRATLNEALRRLRAAIAGS
jgi:cystathionine beta-lyase